jgi:hypothetical protein
VPSAALDLGGLALSEEEILLGASLGALISSMKAGRSVSTPSE